MKINKGFSLAEVLMLFAVLSGILAATIPMLVQHSKAVPTKLPHGLYLCYRDADGKLNQELYSSYKKISESSDVAACTFTPPTNATLFKITLIGAGSGGYAHAVVDDERETVSSELDLDLNYSNESNIFRKLNVSELKTVFGDEQVIFYTNVASGSGGKGCGVQQIYYRTSDLYCTNHSTLPEPTMGDFCTDEELEDDSSTYYVENCLEPYENALEKYPGYKNKLNNYRNAYIYKYRDAIQSQDIEAIGEICHELYGDSVSLPKQANGRESKYGGGGGRGTYATKSYTISKSVADEKYETYLKSIKTSAKKGYCSDPDNCYQDFSDKNEGRMKSGQDCRVAEGKYNSYFITLVYRGAISKYDQNYAEGKTRYIYNNPNWNVYPDDGGDATGAVAIKWKDPATDTSSYEYYTSGTPATGGKATECVYNRNAGSTDFTWNGVYGADGSNATGGYLAPYDSTAHKYQKPSDVIPVGIVSTDRLKRTYTLGLAGNPGTVTTVSMPSLGTSECKMYVGQGTKGHSEDKSHRDLNDAQFKAQVDTVLKCSDLTLTATGGVEQYNTEAHEYIPTERTVDRVTEAKWHKESVPDKTKPTFTKPSFWFRLVSGFPDYSFGEAGSGSYITDKCTWQYGTQLYGTKQQPTKGSFYFPENVVDNSYKCTEADFIGTDGQKLSVGDGKHGAVIIRW